MVAARFSPERVKQSEASSEKKGKTGFDATSAIDKSWRRLTNALSGQFCASLNFLDSTQSVSPIWSLRPTGVRSRKEKPNTDENESYFRFGTCPSSSCFILDLDWLGQRTALLNAWNLPAVLEQHFGGNLNYLLFVDWFLRFPNASISLE